MCYTLEILKNVRLSIFACAILIILLCSHMRCGTTGDYRIMDYSNLTNKPVMPIFSDEGYPDKGDIPMLNRKNYRALHVTIQEHPYIVSIRRNYSHYLTGTILAKAIFLTVAHPVYHIPTYELGVVVGESYADRGKSIMSVVMMVIHGKFNSSTLEHDIAMLRTYEDLVIGFTVKPILIVTDSQSWLQGRSGFVTGWGRCMANKNNGEICLPRSSDYYPYESFDPLLKSVQFEIRHPERHCSTYIKNETPLNDGMLCVGQSRREECLAPCLAVPGAPLVVEGKLIGLASWGFSCGFYDDLPIVYTDARYYNFWITHNLYVLNSIEMSQLLDLYTASRSLVLREAYSLTTVVESMQILLYKYLDPIDEFDTSQMVMTSLDKTLANVRGKIYDVRDFIHAMVFRAAKRYLYRVLRNEPNDTKQYFSDEYSVYLQDDYKDFTMIRYEEAVNEEYEDADYTQIRIN